ncbi:DNA-3-methyladenine glycosylase family protein [Capillimicrobium parvum]|uniref:DNA-3-methyladenine glycosylase II n=1 Tax=Capillimicrobium parvum TaxID=2884022 RepID=A0A9E6XVR8_9ACTN|nr:hypothetical protein [Capillimicrobium parvum]UGS35360.1 hypothetical protein DSM104329_01748 [Capillimicrobium parvum]
MTQFEIQPRGPFSLAAAERFFGRWEATSGAAGGAWAPAPAPAPAGGETVLRVAFLTDDWSGAAGLLVRQASGDLSAPVNGEIVAGSFADDEVVQRQVARLLSLDHEGAGFVAVGERDPVVAVCQRAGDFLRPVLFHSPYEAACWAVISSRMHHRQARRVRSEMGGTLTVDAVALDVFPGPEDLLARDAIPGLNAEKVARLHGIARAALEGRLDRERLLALEAGEAMADVQELRGIGPFGAALIVLRGVGPTDAFAPGEPRLRAAAARVYDRPELGSDEAAFAELAERWRPFRTWVSVLLRATG